MPPRPLRTTRPIDPQSQGERIRYARHTANLTQEQFARALSRVSKVRVNKGTVSKWESDATANPTNASMLAIELVTKVSARWLVHGKGEMFAALAHSTSIDMEALQRAIRIAIPDADPRAAISVATVYDLIVDAPDLSDAVLRKTSDAFKRA